VGKMNGHKNGNIKNKMKNSNANNDDTIEIQSIRRDNLYKANKDLIANPKNDLFDFEIDQEFIEENKKVNLVRHMQNYKHKFAPFTRSQRRKRRMEVYRLHFEKGIPAIRIADMMKVDRNTINNDLKILYNKMLNDYSPDQIILEDILQKQLVRLETQRDRLGLYLCDIKDINSKVAIERLIADIDFKLIGVIERINQNLVRFWNQLIKQINKAAENEKLNTRYTSLFELNRISIDSRKSLDELKEEVLGQKKDV
jgi:hypothetical protein